MTAYTDECLKATGFTSLLAAYLQSEEEATVERRRLRGEPPLRLAADIVQPPVDPPAVEKPKRLSLVG